MRSVVDDDDFPAIGQDARAAEQEATVIDDSDDAIAARPDDRRGLKVPPVRLAELTAELGQPAAARLADQGQPVAFPAQREEQRAAVPSLLPAEHPAATAPVRGLEWRPEAPDVPQAARPGRPVGQHAGRVGQQAELAAAGGASWGPGWGGGGGTGRGP